MRHINDVLTPATIDNAEPKDKRYDLTDGGGLAREVMPSGSKTWRFKGHLNGEREKASIGACPAFTIKQARDRHEERCARAERVSVWRLRGQVVRWLDVNVHPAIGGMLLDEVPPSDVRAIIKARAGTAVTAGRLRVIVQQIYSQTIRNLLVTRIRRKRCGAPRGRVHPTHRVPRGVDYRTRPGHPAARRPAVARPSIRPTAMAGTWSTIRP